MTPVMSPRRVFMHVIHLADDAQADNITMACFSVDCLPQIRERLKQIAQFRKRSNQLEYVAYWDNWCTYLTWSDETFVKLYGAKALDTLNTTYWFLEPEVFVYPEILEDDVETTDGEKMIIGFARFWWETRIKHLDYTIETMSFTDKDLKYITEMLKPPTRKRKR